jgi:hypothetical protein
MGTAGGKAISRRLKEQSMRPTGHSKDGSLDCFGRYRQIDDCVTSNESYRRLSPTAIQLDVMIPATPGVASLPEYRTVIEDWRDRTAAAQKLLTYRHALDTLKRLPSFEDIARQRAILTEEVAQNSQRLWRDWVQFGADAANARATQGRRGFRRRLATHDGTRRRTCALFRATACEGSAKYCDSVVRMLGGHFSFCARKSAIRAGYFDLVVIDEASQCDIASALPLLYRAKRSVIIGDPQQPTAH